MRDAPILKSCVEGGRRGREQYLADLQVTLACAKHLKNVSMGSVPNAYFFVAKRVLLLHTRFLRDQGRMNDDVHRPSRSVSRSSSNDANGVPLQKRNTKQKSREVE